MIAKKPALIEARNISKTYHRGNETITALDNISLDIHAGELLAIVGVSGSGKTTLSQLLGGLMKADTGTLSVNGEELKQSDKQLSKYRNTTVGFVFQSFSLVSSYSALENVQIPLVIANTPLIERRQQAIDYLELVGLGERIHHRANQLSGGERQRVAIARALVNQPKMIIADEPTGSLDSKKGHEIMDVLELLARKQGIAVVMVTHDEALARRADRIVHIKDGKLREVEHANR